MKGHGRHRRHPSKGKNGRSRGLHPVSLNFGRPKIEDFIAETIQGTAVVAEWAGQQGSLLPGNEPRAQPTNLRQVNTISTKHNKTECDRSMRGWGCGQIATDLALLSGELLLLCYAALLLELSA